MLYTILTDMYYTIYNIAHADYNNAGNYDQPISFDQSNRLEMCQKWLFNKVG